MAKRSKSTPVPPASAPASRLIPSLAIFVIALLLRLLAAWQLGSLPLSRTPQLDSAAYLMWAREIVAGGVVWPPYPEHAPGYPFFVAAVLAVSNGSLMAVRIVQAVLGAMACVLTARVAARTVAPRAFVWAGLLQAVYAPLIYIETALLSEAVLVFLLVLMLDQITSAARDAKSWLLSGLALGAACIVRPTALVLVVAFAVVLIRKHHWSRDTRRAALAFGAGVLIVAAPIVIQNWRVTGLPMIQAYGGLNTYLGNRPSGDGGARARPGGEWDRLEGEASRAAVSRNGQDRYYLQKTWSEIADQPGAYAGLLASKLWWTLQDDEVRDTHSYYFFADAWVPLRWLPSYGWILALAAAGAIAARPREPAWLLTYAIAMLATVVLLVIGTRYRMPLVPAIIAFAGAGLAATTDAVRSRRWNTAAKLAGVVAVVWAVTEIRHDPASHNLAEEHALSGLSLLQEGRLAEAETACRTAIDIDPSSSLAWDGLGLVLQRRLLRNEARLAFERAVQINESNATAWLHLGYAHELLKEPDAALRAYRQALAITPQRGDAIALYDAARHRYR
ncbi:MAG TPA: tetratricopeptide repeat protein [Vicinamibacterales bacterium]|nr:tetratricopeptide repeat protein [Vicinamibacterales bacterium]